jgi:ribonuclease P protein component
VKRKFRLTRSTDFKRVRRFGKSYAHPLIVLVALPNEQGITRFAVSAGRSVGNAVQRNRAKRLIREALRPLLPAISPGWNVILLSRRPMAEASFQNVQSALMDLLQRAYLLEESDDQ